MIRWKGIAVFAGIIVFVFVLSLFLTDQWLENRLEDAGSSLVGAKVEIDGLDIEILDMYMGLNHLQITDPKHTMKNIVETGPIKMDIEFWPLLTGAQRPLPPPIMWKTSRPAMPVRCQRK